jgi:hypothetical protein
LHEKQLPLQALLQQTPWAHWLDRHSLAREQALPWGLSPQEPFTQVAGAWQSLLLEQTRPQLAPLHLYGAQEVAAGTLQAPLRQVASWV